LIPETFRVAGSSLSVGGTYGRPEMVEPGRIAGFAESAQQMGRPGREILRMGGTSMLHTSESHFMTNRHRPLALALTFLTCSVLAAPRDALWKEVEDAVNKGLPKTAIEKLQPIIDAAVKEKKYAEAIKGIGKKIALEGNIQGNKPEE